MPLSVTAPLSKAWDDMVRILFKPFDIKKWLAMGFCSFLATCGEGSTSYCQFPGGGGGGPGGGGFNPQDILDWMAQNLVLTVLIVTVVVLAFAALLTVVMWLGCRGRFMLLHAVATNRGVVAEGWRDYARQGNSLLWFKIAVQTLALTLVLLVVAAAAAVAWGMGLPQQGMDALVPVFIVAALLLAPIALGYVAFMSMVEIVVLPVMYARRLRAWPACQEAWRVMVRPQPSLVFLCLLMHIALGIGGGVVAFVVTCATCCLAGLPYVSSVVFLPISVFFYAYRLRFVEQFDSAYQVMQGIDPTAICIACGYDLRGNPLATHCPECGNAIPRPEPPVLPDPWAGGPEDAPPADAPPG